MLLATQGGVNSTLGKNVGKSFASVVSFSVGLGALVVFFLVDYYGLGSKGPTAASVAATPWWAWVGGPLGAFYVAVAIIYAPVLGAATLMALFVTCQLATAVTLDALGWVGFSKRKLHWARLLGVGLMVAGVVLVTYFDGTSAASGGGPHAAAPGPPSSRAAVELSGAEGRRTPPNGHVDAAVPALALAAATETAAVGEEAAGPGSPASSTKPADHVNHNSSSSGSSAVVRQLPPDNAAAAERPA